MKKMNYLIWGFILFSPLALWAQTYGTAREVLSGNQALGTFTNDGALFYREDGTGLRVPYFPGNEEVSTMYAAGLWLTIPGENGAEDASSSVSIYRSVNHKFDFAAGPLTSDGHLFEIPLFSYFNKIWIVNRLDILNFLEDFEDNQVLDDPIPMAIRQWPAKGNPWVMDFYGIPIPDQELAPFYDRNGDGLYHPEEGDYPILDPENPMVIPDQLMWYVFNDVYLHTQSSSDSMIVEVQVTAYSFLCEDNPLLNTTIFTRHKIINKSGETLEGFKPGFWYDSDLGCREDDYFGCDTTLNAVYFYNADAIDGDEDCACFDGTIGYCEAPPVQAMTLLNQELSTANYYFDNGLPDSPSMSVNAPAPFFYHLLNGNLTDGTPMTYGGTGFDTTTTIPTSFAFPDAPLNAEGWSMYTANLEGEDVRGILSIPAIDLPDQASITIDVAYSFHRRPGQDFLQNVDVMLEEIPLIRSSYEDGFTSFCSQLPLCVEDCVWPGDANNDQLVSGEDYLAIGLALGHEASGPARSIISANWFPLTVENWAQTFVDGTNTKHADCNGDGQISLQDADVTTASYTLSTPSYQPEPDVESMVNANGLFLTQSKDTISTNTSGLQRLLRTYISLGLENDPVEDIYGLSFTVIYDTSFLTTAMGFNMVQINNEFFTEDVVLEHYYIHPESNRIDFSFCNTNGETITNFGQLAYLNFFIRIDGETAHPSGAEEIEFKVVNLKAIDAEGNRLLDIGAQIDPVVVTDLTVGNNEIVETMDEVQLFPNPNSGTLHFRLPSEAVNFPLEVVLYDPLGKKVAGTQIAEKQEEWSWSLPTTISNGTYFIRINSVNQQSTRSYPFLLNR